MQTKKTYYPLRKLKINRQFYEILICTIIPFLILKNGYLNAELGFRANYVLALLWPLGWQVASHIKGKSVSYLGWLAIISFGLNIFILTIPYNPILIVLKEATTPLLMYFAISKSSSLKSLFLDPTYLLLQKGIGIKTTDKAEDAELKAKFYKVAIRWYGLYFICSSLLNLLFTYKFVIDIPERGTDLANAIANANIRISGIMMLVGTFTILAIIRAMKATAINKNS